MQYLQNMSWINTNYITLFMKKNIKSKRCLQGILTAVLLIIAPFMTFAQNTIKVTGTVTDDTAQPVIGASVMIKGSTTGVPTDLDGKYTITVPSDAILEFSSVGLSTTEVSVNGRTTLNVVMKADNTFLESVVVVGYGTQKKGSITGAVSGVGNDDIVKTKSENPQNMLTGRVPGLRVWQKSAEPGTYNNVFDIRGMGSPLVIIDGVPRDIADFQRLNSTDIENVSVLKDAAAAIYGVRAGNGVVLVTTKKGAEGKAKVNYNGSFTFQTPSKMPELASAVESMMIYNEKSNNSVHNGSVQFTPDQIEEYRSGAKRATDWNNMVLANWVPQTQHDISISGGSEKFQYYVSMGYIYQEGFFKSGDLNYDKYNLRANINAELVKGLKFDINVNGVADQRDTPWSSSVDIIRNYWGQGQLAPAYADPEGTMLNSSALDKMENSVAMMTSDISGYHKYKQKYFQSSVSLSYDFGTITDALTGLNLKGLFSYDFRYDDNEHFRKEYYLYEYDKASDSYKQQVFPSHTNQLRRETYNKQQVLGQVILSYDRTFAKKHKVGALVGWEVQKRDGDNYYAFGDLATGTPYFTGLDGKNQTVGVNKDRNAFYEIGYEALIGRINYGFDDRYLVEAQFRYDGSSKFAPGHQWGFFPSASIGWRISEEPFFQNSSALSFINQLKVRASYGVLGDDGGDLNYQWVSGYTYKGGETSDNGWFNGFAPGYIFDGEFVYGVDPQPIPNTNITWLTSKTFNVGVDFEAWNGMLGLSLDYFNRTRTGIFKQNTNSLPTIVGAGAPMENADSDRHLGLELELSHRHKVGDFSYELKGIVTVTRQKYIKSVQKGNFGNSYDRWRNDNLNNRYQGVQFGYEGNGRYESWEDIWNYPIYKENGTLPGDYKYLDWNGDGEINGNDMHPYAFDQTPWLNYSLDFRFNWRNLDFSMLLQGTAMGSMSYQEPLYSIWGYAAGAGGVLTQYLDRWHPTNGSTDIYDPELEWTKGYYGYSGRYPDMNSTFNRVSTAFLRLKSVEIGYTLPKFKSHAMRDFSLRVFFNAYNPFTITGVKFVDPEHSDDELGRLYPLNKTYTLGLNLTF